MNRGVLKQAGIIFLVFLAFFGVALGLHEFTGANDSGFASVDDEPAHYVTGLMFRDYVAEGFPGNPLTFAKDYYLNYPKVAIGQWPPVFYVLQGAWMLVFGVSTLSMIALMSALTAAIATIVYAVVRAELSALAGAAGGLLFLLMPTVQFSSGAVMTEIPLALFCLLAALQLGRFVSTERARHAFGFAIFSILAILTKGNALALGLAPLLAIALAGKWRLLLRPSLWGSGLLVGLLCGPWYKLALPISASTWAGGGSPTLAYSLEAIVFYAQKLVGLGGFLVAALAVLGIVTRPTDAARRGAWAALLAVTLSLLLMHIVVPSSITPRHLVLVAPIWVLFVAMGMRRLGEWRLLDRPHAKRVVAFAPVLMLVVFAFERFEITHKHHSGYRDAAGAILADASLDGTRLLIASDARGEGLFTAAIAQAEERPGHAVVRASKVLGRTNWMGDAYEPIFENREDVAGFLKSIPTAVVVLDDSIREDQTYSYHADLRAIIEAAPDEWELIEVFDVVRHGVDYPDALRLYRLHGHEAYARVELDLDRVLGREVPSL